MKSWIAASLLASTSLGAHAQSAPVTAERAWVRATVQGQMSSGGYLTLNASEPLTLVGASTPVAGTTEVHEMRMEGEVMRMRQVEGIPVTPGKPLELKPGGYHLMLMQLRTPLQPQARVPLTLTFRNAAGATRTLSVSAEVLAAPPAAHAHPAR